MLRNQATAELVLGNWGRTNAGDRWEPMVYEDQFGNIRYRNPPYNDPCQDVIYQTHVMPGVNAWRTGPYMDVANTPATTATPADVWTADSITRILDELRDENHSYDTVRADTTPRHPDDVIVMSQEEVSRFFDVTTPVETGKECIELDPSDLYGGAEGEDANG